THGEYRDDSTLVVKHAAVQPLEFVSAANEVDVARRIAPTLATRPDGTHRGRGVVLAQQPCEPNGAQWFVPSRRIALYRAPECMNFGCFLARCQATRI